MATDLQKLKVSLTKHGAHKLADLLVKYDRSKVLDHLDDVAGDKIDEPQAKATLAVGTTGVVPELWSRARNQGKAAVRALVFLAIVFSHHRLISAMRAGARSRYIGTIVRGAIVDDKEFTNFSREVQQLGFCTSHSKVAFEYDLSSIFTMPEFNKLVAALIERKLKHAGWTGDGNLADEAVNAGLHEVLAVSESQFRNWLNDGKLVELGLDEEAGDSEFFFNASDRPIGGKFTFRPGHKPKKIGAVDVAAGSRPTRATLIHNAIQNSLYSRLVQEHGKECVGTEIDTGDGTAIDVVVKIENKYRFYEIKTARSVKSCVRQAIPQLLEYAYWRLNRDHVEKLIIVSMNKASPAAEEYLAFLRKEFGLEIFYEQHVVA